MFESIFTSVLSRVMEKAFSNPVITVDNLYVAIKDDMSLWGEGENTISGYSSMIPDYLKNVVASQLGDFEEKYGKVSHIASLWIRDNRPELYSLILNTPSGNEWLDRQVDEILKGVGIVKV